MRGHDAARWIAGRGIVDGESLRHVNAPAKRCQISCSQHVQGSCRECKAWPNNQELIVARTTQREITRARHV
eukprot:12904999-Prorocentrum_lima.AAC.1